MGGYGFCFYGPYQHFWNGQLDKFFPTRSLAHFGSKVCLGYSLKFPVHCGSTVHERPSPGLLFMPFENCGCILMP